ncbi:hypothetical protein IscW_ISCW002537 [Ixodes scapularis]|uniref:Uncharacterized protein n=1 Tax=Ixodes scapularis TaxID=6945 RepID=B7P9E3_IXOSC|nr:hypothetical protein IscW_ISCW002537 [Ixodes scapularis]|eukprot:XP_002404060.1 hypothetical protein IscW_ISCW002537 [Ixodes scapularis]
MRQCSDRAAVSGWQLDGSGHQAASQTRKDGQRVGGAGRRIGRSPQNDIDPPGKRATEERAIWTMGSGGLLPLAAIDFVRVLSLPRSRGLSIRLSFAYLFPVGVRM